MDRTQMKISPLPSTPAHADLVNKEEPVYWSAHVQYGKPGTKGVDYFSFTLVLDTKSVERIIFASVSSTPSYRDNSFEGYLNFYSEERVRDLFKNLFDVDYTKFVKDLKKSNGFVEYNGVLKDWFDQAKNNFENVVENKMKESLLDMVIDTEISH